MDIVGSTIIYIPQTNFIAPFSQSQLLCSTVAHSSCHALLIAFAFLPLIFTYLDLCLYLKWLTKLDVVKVFNLFQPREIACMQILHLANLESSATEKNDQKVDFF